ncbi:MAG TPA: ADOP family duplicated permease [Thermoanaerobaculia bacterium]|nr:ADOP family duplicated permease [Thermoanaerobaculia bacterium]
MDLLIAELRHAGRTFLRQPGYAAVSVLLLALGIGANTALFSLFSAAVLAPLSYPAPDRLINVLATHPGHAGAPGERVAITPADFLAWRSQSQAFRELGAYVPFGSLDWTGAGDPVQLSRHLVSAGLLSALQVEPERGRWFAADEYRPEGRRAVLLSHRLWLTRFGADPAAVGRPLTLSGEVYTVVGVLPAGFRLPGGDPDLLVPLVFGAGAPADRKAAYLGAIGRLAPGVSRERAEAELDLLCRRLTREHPEIMGGLGASLVPLAESFVGPARQALWLLLGAVGLVFLIACADVANLQLVRASAQAQETAIRRALGAGRLQLLRPRLAESGLLALAGGVLGLPLAALALRLLPDARGIYLPRSLGVRLDLRVLGYGFLLCLLAALATALPALWKTDRAPLQLVLRGGRTSPGRRRLQEALAVTGVALSFVLLIGAGLLVRSFTRLVARDPGFDSRGRLTFDVALPATRYPEARQAAAFYHELVLRLARLPGVRAVGAAKEIPPAEPWGFSPAVEGEPSVHKLSLGWEVVEGRYFAALGSPVLRGRPLDAGDRAGSPLAAVLSAGAARRLFPGREPLGRRVRFNGRWFTVVGVVGNLWSPGQAEPAPIFYVAAAQTPVPADLLRSLSLVVHVAGDPRSLARPVLDTLRALDGGLPAANLLTLEERQRAGLAFGRSRFDTVLLGTFSALALLLASLGLYGVLAYRVAEQIHEMGIRLALGARPGDLIGLVLGRGLLLTLAGLAAGLPGAFAVARLLASRLAAVEGAGSVPAAAGIAALTLAAAALAAGALPAVRAGRLDPVRALRISH